MEVSGQQTERTSGNKKKCRQHGVVLDARVLDGLCLNCLWEQGVKGRPAESTETFEPPWVESLAKAMHGVELIAPIGQGGMGAVYKARQFALNRIVAVKFMAPHAVEDGSNYNRFTREALSLVRFNHRNVVRIHDFEPAANFPYFVMDFVDGPSLHQMLKSGPLGLSQAVPLFLQLCDGLQHVHERHVIHRDIKPANLLVDKEGVLKIVDFGLAKLNAGAGASSEWQTSDGQRVGTRGYMAPEQVENPEAVDHRADIYSAGAVLFEMLTGDPPSDPFPALSEKAKVDSSLDKVLFRALEKDPAHRYQDIGEFKQAVEAVFASSASALQKFHQIDTCDLKGQRQGLAKLLRENPGDAHLEELIWKEFKRICDQLNDEEGRVWACLGLASIYQRQRRLAEAALERKKSMSLLPTAWGFRELKEAA